MKFKNWMLEAYVGKEKRGWLVSNSNELNIDEARKFLVTLSDSEEFIAEILSQLIEQSNDPDKFPNVVMFFDENLVPLSLTNYMTTLYKNK